MAKYRPLLLVIVCFALGALVWLDNRGTILSMWNSAAPSPSSATAQITPLDNAKSERDTAPDQKPTTEVSLLTGNPLASFDKASLENWVKRPLFAPSRRRPPPQEAKSKIAPPQPPPDYQLLGVLLNPERTIALLRSEDTGTDFHVQVGDMLKGWLVASVERDAVTLKRDDETSQVIRFKKACSDSGETSCP